MIEVLFVAVLGAVIGYPLTFGIIGALLMWLFSRD